MAELITVARPYAEAVFRLAKDSNTLIQWSDVLGNLALIAENQAVLDVVANPKCSADQVQELLVELLGTDANAEVKNFLAAVLENRRFATLPAMSALFEQLKSADEGVAQAHIESAFAMTDAQLAELTATLTQQLKRKISADVSINPELIGGVKVTIGDLVIDASVSGKLATLATSLKS